MEQHQALQKGLSHTWLYLVPTITGWKSEVLHSCLFDREVDSQRLGAGESHTAMLPWVVGTHWQVISGYLFKALLKRMSLYCCKPNQG